MFQTNSFEFEVLDFRYLALYFGTRFVWDFDIRISDFNLSHPLPLRLFVHTPLAASES